MPTDISPNTLFAALDFGEIANLGVLFFVIWRCLKHTQRAFFVHIRGANTDSNGVDLVLGR